MLTLQKAVDLSRPPSPQTLAPQHLHSGIQLVSGQSGGWHKGIRNRHGLLEAWAPDTGEDLEL